MSLAYDARGNLLSQSGEARHGASHTVSWRSDNLPQLIEGPSGYRSEFFYTPERSRWKQQASYGGTSETTVYLGGLLTKVTLGATTAWKHAIQGVEGTVALYTRKSTGTNEVHYLTRDHLGSVTAVTDASTLADKFFRIPRAEVPVPAVHALNPYGKTFLTGY